MSLPTIILNIGPGSDGDSSKFPAAGTSYVRNDDYFRARIGEAWAKDQGLPHSSQYIIDRLPANYAGFQKSRGAGGGDTKHVDRYLYGHPRGLFRSIVEIFPHFKSLMENGNANSCTCVRCDGQSGRKSTGGGELKPIVARKPREDVSPASQTRRPAQKSTRPFATELAAAPSPSTGRPRGGFAGLRQGKPSPDPVITPRGKQVDAEGTIDIYRQMLDRVKSNAPESVNEAIEEHMSPDWRVGHDLLIDTLDRCSKQDAYLPRLGELVMFVRHLEYNKSLGWDNSIRTFRIIDLNTNSWLERPKWEAGVITQIPTEAIVQGDLVTQTDKKQAINNSGFRIEPMSRPNSITKAHTRQHTYAPLHAIRPFALWQDCVAGLDEKTWHPTIRHACTVANTFCVVAPFHFKGTWPEATLFVKAVYIGPELLTIGDTVRLHPAKGDKNPDVINDILVITAIKLRFIRLDEASVDDYVDAHPYNTCLHISGRAYTFDARRSFDGVGKVPVSADSKTLPPGILELGPWYPLHDPANSKTRLEVPFTRVIGRCCEAPAIEAWYTPPTNIAAPTTTGFKAVNTPLPTIATPGANVSRGLSGILDARAYSQEHDTRIDKEGGKTWFWANDRVELLDLHEVNGRNVGISNTERAKEMSHWRKEVKAMPLKKREGLRDAHEPDLGLVADKTDVFMLGGGEESSGGAETADAMEIDAMDKGFGGSGNSVDEMDVDEEDGEGGNPLDAFRAGSGSRKARGVVEIASDEGEDDDDQL